MRNVDWLSSVWRIDASNPQLLSFEGISHKATFPEDLAYRLIYLFSKPGDYVLDPFCGSGTTNYVALSLARNTVGYDVEEKYIDTAKRRCKGKGMFFCKSSKHLSELSNDSVDFCLTSPPYLKARKYSTKKENIGNSRNPLIDLRVVFEEVFRVLKTGRFFCLNVSNVAENGYLTTFPFDCLYSCLDIGFNLRSSIVWDKGIHIKEYNLKNREIAENHEYVWVLKK